VFVADKSTEAAVESEKFGLSKGQHTLSWIYEHSVADSQAQSFGFAEI
jgi:hypothetical protein